MISDLLFEEEHGSNMNGMHVKTNSVHVYPNICVYYIYIYVCVCAYIYIYI